VGSVQIASIPGTSTNTFGAHPLSSISSVIPVGGGLSTVLNFPHDGSLDGDALDIPKIVNGVFSGYNVVSIDSVWTSGYGNALDNAQVLEPVIPVATGFFFVNYNGGSVAWVQTLSP
jgi:hypothetical protein